MIDLVRLSAADLQSLQVDGSLTSSDLAKLSLQQIAKYDIKGPELRAIIALVPEKFIFERTTFLDEERRAGRLLGPLHGIPIILKDIINTPPEWGILTTQGSWALEKSKHKEQAPLVKKLLDAGVVIIGKTSLTEFGSAKGPEGVGGLSAINGQSQSVYVEGFVAKGDEPFAHTNPGGSSTGSAVGVAAGYSPISIGGEANGSIQTPASRANLYALKITPQTLSTEGIFHIVPTVESLGGMAKAVGDLEEVTRVILQTAKTPVEMTVDRSKTWKDFGFGFVEPGKWRLPSDLFNATEEYCQQIDTAYSAIQEKIKGFGGKVAYPADVPHPSTIDNGFIGIVNGEFRDTVNSYLQNLAESEVRSLAEIIQFNKDHPELQAGISQPWFIGPQEFEQTPEEYAKVRKQVREDAGEKGLYRVMDELSLDIICAPTDGPISEISALAGAPTANIPLGFLEPSGRPFGLTLVGRPGSEGKMLEIMYLFEAASPERRLPKLVE
jgi:amidase